MNSFNWQNFEDRVTDRLVMAGSKLSTRDIEQMMKKEPPLLLKTDYDCALRRVAADWLCRKPTFAICSRSAGHSVILILTRNHYSKCGHRLIIALGVVMREN